MNRKLIQSEKKPVLNRRSRMAKNANPYNNNPILKEPKVLRKSANRAAMAGKSMKKIKAERKNKEISVQNTSHSRYNIWVRKNSGRLSEDPGSHRERQSVEDYSKVLKKLKKIGAGSKQLRNKVHDLETENQFIQNQENALYSRKSQCRRQPSQSKISNKGESKRNEISISPTVIENIKKRRGSGSRRKSNRKYSNADYDSIGTWK